MRDVCIYQVADSAVSRLMFEDVLRKNLPLLSARSYAYRKDLSGQNAVQYIASEFGGRSRLYIAEYDFSTYFDSISHEHIKRVLEQHFLLTENERRTIGAFLGVGYQLGAYTPVNGPPRSVGIPQGTSISLFLANVAAWELDRALEGVGVGFARYADDTLIWSKDYGRICEAVEILHSHAQQIGSGVNLDKSDGISLLVPPGTKHTELPSKTHVDYLGHRISTRGMGLRETTVERFRQHVAQMIFNNLLREPLAGKQDTRRLTSVDRDYATLIWGLRRYVYGDLSERAVRRFSNQGAPLRRYTGFMSAYPQIDDRDGLRELDSWVLDRLFLALRKRGRLLGSQPSPLPPPHGVARDKLRRLTHRSGTTGQFVDLTVPSLHLISSVIADAASRYGPAAIGRPDLKDY